MWAGRHEAAMLESDIGIRRSSARKSRPIDTVASWATVTDLPTTGQYHWPHRDDVAAIR